MLACFLRANSLNEMFGGAKCREKAVGFLRNQELGFGWPIFQRYIFSGNFKNFSRVTISIHLGTVWLNRIWSYSWVIKEVMSGTLKHVLMATLMEISHSLPEDIAYAYINNRILVYIMICSRRDFCIFILVYLKKVSCTI